MTSFDEQDMDLENVSLACFIPYMPFDVDKDDFAYLTQPYSSNTFDEYIADNNLNNIEIDWNLIDMDISANNLSFLNTPTRRLSTPDIFRDMFDDDHSVVGAANVISSSLEIESHQHTIQHIEIDQNMTNTVEIDDSLNNMRKKNDDDNEDEKEEEEAMNGNIDNCNTSFYSDNDLLLISSSQTSSDMVTSAPYPPVHRYGRVSDHDRPYLQYEHIDRATMVKLCRLKIQPPPHPPPPPSPSPSLSSTSSNVQRKNFRFSRRVFAIVSYTELTKERLMNFLKEEFPIDNIQYLCVAQTRSDINQQSILEIQIMLKKKVNKKSLFLDSITNTKCNYHVTNNDVAWNAYIKKTMNFVEHNYFKSNTIRGFRTWPLDPIAQLTAEVRTKRALADAASRRATKAAAKAEDMKQMAALARQIAEEAANKLATQPTDSSYSLPFVRRKPIWKARIKRIT
ncbi:unnamed protein product [Rotaria sordida]|uniref:Uncharacterized protein n=1 Tax=Rotaria sordida TaxID=392033 RepID=A0A819UHM0_9BILA|nr:unnamed protein product [Rotaria sordida]CAF4097116.1 unnamed protein product [Rotaria sordida]